MEPRRSMSARQSPTPASDQADSALSSDPPSPTRQSSRFSFFGSNPAKHRRTNSQGDAGKALAEIGSTFKSWRTSLETYIRKESATMHGVDFLQDVPKAAAQDVGGQLKAFIHDFEAVSKQRSVQELSDQVLQFYRHMEERMDTTATYEQMTQEQCREVMDGMERHIMAHIYDSVFALDPEDEQKDLALQRRIRNLRWVTPAHLEARFAPECAEVIKNFEDAQEELITVDAKRAAQDKLECIVRCSEAVYQVLKESSQQEGKPQSADDFLPVMIYVVIRANPPLLHSNLQFIQRFCNPAVASSGERGYYFTNLEIAVSFVENLTASQLKIPEDDFRRYMDGDLSEKGLPEMANQGHLRNQLERLRRLATRQKVLQEDIDALNEAMDRLCASAVQPVMVSASLS